jgi:hypothetical protein
MVFGYQNKVQKIDVKIFLGKSALFAEEFEKRGKIAAENYFRLMFL